MAKLFNDDKVRQELNNFKLFSSTSNAFFHKFPLQTSQEKITNRIRPIKEQKKTYYSKIATISNKTRTLKKKKISDYATPEKKFQTLTNTFNS